MIYRYDNICRTNCALNKVLFGALVLMLLTIFVPNSTIRRCSSGTNFLNENKHFYENLVYIVFKTVPALKCNIV